MEGQAPLGRLTREQWIARFGDQLGVARHQPALLRDQYHLGAPIGRGAFGTVRQSNENPDTAIKRQLGDIGNDVPQWNGPAGSRTLDLIEFAGAAVEPPIKNEIDIQARLGNELGIMPAIQVVESGPYLGEPNNFIAMDNLRSRGYKELGNMDDAFMPDSVFNAKLRAERSILEAWAARAGIATRDTHDSNVMALPASSAAEDDGSRVKLIDAGYFEKLPNNPVRRLNTETRKVVQGYQELGLGNMGVNLGDVVFELVERGDIDGARYVVNEALSDLAVRQESLDEEQLARNRRADTTARMAGDIWSDTPYVEDLEGNLHRKFSSRRALRA